MDELWRQPRTESVRNQLVLKHLYIVKGILRRLLRRTYIYPAEPSDLYSAGTFGLIQAVERYNPDTCPRFDLYCTKRIHGAMIDELRRLDWAPRAVRQRKEETPSVSIGEVEVLTDDGPTQAAQRSDIQRLVNRNLTDKERRILRLRYYDGLTFRQIAELTDASLAVVFDAHTHVLDLLRTSLVGREDEFVLR